MNIIRHIHLAISIASLTMGLIFNDSLSLQLGLICMILYRIFNYENVLVVIDKNFDAVESRLKQLEEKQ